MLAHHLSDNDFVALIERVQTQRKLAIAELDQHEPPSGNAMVQMYSASVNCLFDND